MKRHRNSKGRFVKGGHSKHKKNKSRRRRKNGGRAGFYAAKAAQMAHAHVPGKKSRKKSRARKSSRKSWKHIRPTVLVGPKNGRYYRPRRSKYFKRATRINGRRRRNGTSIMSAIKNVFQVRTIAQYASIGGGLFAGTLLSKLLNTGLVPFTSYQLPASVTDTLSKVRPAHGLIHILAGTLLAAKSRNKYLKDAGIGLAALGGFDLLMQGLSMAGVKNLPTFSGMNVNLMGMTQYMLPNSAGGVPPRMSGMNVNLRGMNVDLMGDAWADECESNHLADNINDMVS